MSERIKAGDVFIVDEFAVKEPKSKNFATAIAKITEEPKTLVVSAAFDKNTYLRGPQRATHAAHHGRRGEHLEQLLHFRKIVITNDGLAQIADRLAK